MKVLFIFLSIFIASLGHAQSLNDYKYVIVDNQYEFQNEANEYRLNEMMVFEIEKRGLTAYRNTSVLPQDLNKGTCNALTLKVTSSSGLRVKMKIEFVNCSSVVVFTTKDGIGRTKVYQKAYREAVRDAMTSLDEINYTYSGGLVDRPSGIEVPIQIMQPSAVSVDMDIKSSVKVVTEVPSDIPSSELVEQVGDEIYFTDSKEYKIQSTKTGFNIYNKNNLIGTLKKSQSGCYFAITSNFTGIGYEKDDSLVIEYDKNGTQFLVFKKAK